MDSELLETILSQSKTLADLYPESDPVNDGDYDVTCHLIQIDCYPNDQEIDILSETGFEAIYGWDVEWEVGSWDLENISWTDHGFVKQRFSDSGGMTQWPRVPANPWAVSSGQKLKATAQVSSTCKGKIRFYGSKKMPS